VSSEEIIPSAARAADSTNLFRFAGTDHIRFFNHDVFGESRLLDEFCAQAFDRVTVKPMAFNPSASRRREAG
jgi:hypothetical protein